MVVKKLAAAAITALTVASAVCVTSYAAAAEKESAERAIKYYYPTITAAVGASGTTDELAIKEVAGNGDGGITSGLPSGEAVWLTIMTPDGYMASDGLYFTAYGMENHQTYAIYYGPNKGVVGDSYKLRVVYQRQYSYSPEQITVKAKWRP